MSFCWWRFMRRKEIAADEHLWEIIVKKLDNYIERFVERATYRGSDQDVQVCLELLLLRAQHFFSLYEFVDPLADLCLNRAMICNKNTIEIRWWVVFDKDPTVRFTANKICAYISFAPYTWLVHGREDLDISLELQLNQSTLLLSKSVLSQFCWC